MCADTPILKPTPLVVALSKELINQVNLQADGQHQDSSDKSTNIPVPPLKEAKKPPESHAAGSDSIVSYVACLSVNTS